MDKLARLQQALGYRFTSQQLLLLALTHRSVGSRNNERLEFLGDSIVNHVVAEALYHRFPTAREGDLSRMRAALVRGDSLAELAAELELGEYLVLGEGERKSGGHRRASILADALEAIAGAMLLDSGYEAVRSCLLGLFESRLDGLDLSRTGKDPKTRLQEYLQARHYPLPEYRLLRVEGEDHRQYFHVSCELHKPPLQAEGSGSSRRRAEQAAAEHALSRLQDA